jgi:hypothetical protein
VTPRAARAAQQAAHDKRMEAGEAMAEALLRWRGINPDGYDRATDEPVIVNELPAGLAMLDLFNAALKRRQEQKHHV